MSQAITGNNPGTQLFPLIDSLGELIRQSRRQRPAQSKEQVWAVQALT